MKPHFTPTPPPNAVPIPFHQCTSHTDGDWTVWRCPLCPGYERRFNRVTGEMQVRRGGSTALHSGMAGAGDDMVGLTQGLCSN